MLATMLNQTLQIVTRVGAEDENHTPIESTETTATTPGRLQQLRATEDRASRESASSDWICYLPADVDIARVDQIVDPYGRTFEVFGTPYPVQSPMGTHHFQITVRLVEG